MNCSRSCFALQELRIACLYQISKTWSKGSTQGFEKISAPICFKLSENHKKTVQNKSAHSRIFSFFPFLFVPVSHNFVRGYWQEGSVSGSAGDRPVERFHARVAAGRDQGDWCSIDEKQPLIDLDPWCTTVAMLLLTHRGGSHCCVEFIRFCSYFWKER